MSARVARERVQRGAAFLDRDASGWWRDGKIDLDRLNVEGCTRCVLGQLYGAYFDAPVMNAIEEAGGDWHGWAVSHGFNTRSPLSDECSTDELTEAWHLEILHRRGQADALAEAEAAAQAGVAP